MTAKADRELVVKAFQESRWPEGTPTLADAWLGIYQVLCWYEHGYLHIREANDLKKNKTWQARAKLAELRVAEKLNVTADEVRGLVDKMMQLPRWMDADGTSMQRNNPLGHGLRMLVSEVLTRWGDPRFTYPEEAKPKGYFPGIVLPGRSDRASIDVLIRTENGRPRAIVSCKWSIRHDRISDPTNECTQYKSAAVQQQLMNLYYCVVTNEMDGQRLDKVLNQPCVDALVHVNLDLAMELTNGGTPLMIAGRGARRLLDLTELAQLTFFW
jgi:hypothetical protein